MRNRFFFAFDACVLPLATYLAFVCRFEGTQLGTKWNIVLVGYLLCSYPVKLGVLYGAGMYRRLWRYASIADLEHTVAACAVSSVLAALIGAVILPALNVISTRVPMVALLLDAGFTTVFVTGSRLLARARATRAKRVRKSDGRPAIIVGAGHAGLMIVRELLENAQVGMRPVGFVDDDPAKHGLHIHGIPVLGSLEELAGVAASRGAKDVIVAIPSAPGAVLRQIVRRASEGGLVTRTVPGLYEIVSGQKSVSALRKIEIDDLLRRAPISTDVDEVGELVSGRTVLVTGAGGSIGSELCRQLARLGPARVIAVGRGENSIFELLQQFHIEFPQVHIEPVIADVRDTLRIQRIFEKFRPYSVFHAAAHKHVPLMEGHVGEAVLNNILGTRNVVNASVSAGTKHFVLISTDKAVRPTSVMGATKRIAEMIVNNAALANPGFVCVRFGNVLGSRGSVVRTFMRQIAAGGPVTVTDPEMTRYFMTIPEAVQLVLQAAAMRAQGEVFVLDMGEPVRVLDLANDMIRLSGLDVAEIEIRFSGMRPGEKLFEELFFDASTARRTTHEKVLCVRHESSLRGSVEKIDALIAAGRTHSSRELRRMLYALVPEYSNGGTEREVPLNEIAPASRTPYSHALGAIRSVLGDETQFQPALPK